jgi:hypothetical protein
MGNLSWDCLYGIVMEQYAKGINNLIPHGVWYNLDHVTYLPELSYRNPRYAAGLPDYNAYLGRLNVLLQAPGRHVADIAVLYPIATMQAGYRFDGPISPYCGGVNVPEADYVYLGELLSTKVCRDFTFLHPEVLDDRSTVDGNRLKLNNKINHEEYRVVILPGHRTIRWSNLKRIKQFYDNGGRVIATGQLPSKSAEFGHDADVASTIREMFPKGDQVLTTASSEWRESGAFEATKATDGSPDTCWKPADEQSKDWWLEVDFGRPRTFNSTVVREASGRITSYRIQVPSGDARTTCASGGAITPGQIDRFKTVTASRVRLCIDAASGNPSISEFEVYLDGGPNLAHSDSLIVQDGKNGGRTIYVNSPNETNLRKALDLALDLYDVTFDGNQNLRYIHRVNGTTDVYFFANLGEQPATAFVRLRGKIDPEFWNPHTGKVTACSNSHVVEHGQPVTRVKLTLGPVLSIFVVGKP